ncbi:MAG: histidine--tRNA ligase [Lachnospiraceae bacterium]|nr:histidine--tRNA ligase [Lachnospiraceae bacterium]
MLKKKPVTGMRDMSPKEMEIRDYVLKTIREVYTGYGFTQIETPVCEHLANLTSKQGGDNEKLIFKILKRGNKLHLDTATCEEDVSDMGLRYDLTVPLCRYYSAHKEELPAPFKALQTGPVWRADRPQKGRFRQFVQYDIDILGEPTVLAEIELILAMTDVLDKLSFEHFTIRINDRRLLTAMVAYAGFPAEETESVLITLDKMDKIGMEGVLAEWKEKGYDDSAAGRFAGLLEKVSHDKAGISICREALAGQMDGSVCDDLLKIMQVVGEVTRADVDLVFDPTLVRGMGYYTGTIFEIAMAEADVSVGGGGRYDKMIGKFTGQDVPACGFSIGFERIMMVLMEKGFTPPDAREKEAVLLEKNLDADQLSKVFAEAQAARDDGHVVNVTNMKKNKKFQRESLAEQGYTEFKDVFKEK